MDQDLKIHLDAMERRITERVEGHIDAMEGRIVDRVTERVAGRIDASEDRMKMHVAEAIHTSETKLLGEFWKWARTADARYRQNAGMTSGFADRVTLVEERIAELERNTGTA